MNFFWQKSKQYTYWGVLEPGREYNSVALGIPAGVLAGWIGGAWAVEVKTKEVKKHERAKKAK